jgi:hypothetical protein
MGMIERFQLSKDGSVLTIEIQGRGPVQGS